MGEFRSLLLRAKQGSMQDFERLVVIFKVRLESQAWIDNRVDEDLYQEMLITLYKVIQNFPIEDDGEVHITNRK